MGGGREGGEGAGEVDVEGAGEGGGEGEEEGEEGAGGKVHGLCGVFEGFCIQSCYQKSTLHAL